MLYVCATLHSQHDKRCIDIILILLGGLGLNFARSSPFVCVRLHSQQQKEGLNIILALLGGFKVHKIGEILSPSHMHSEQ
jgi:hypothetical protein